MASKFLFWVDCNLEVLRMQLHLSFGLLHEINLQPITIGWVIRFFLGEGLAVPSTFKSIDFSAFLFFLEQFEQLRLVDD